MKKIYIHPNYKPEEWMELHKRELSNNPDFQERAKAAYRAELQHVAEDYGELNAAEASIFLDLLERKAQQNGTVEDSLLSGRLQVVYSLSQTKETELPEIESDRELAIFLNLLEEKVSQSGYLPDKQWTEQAKEIFQRDRNKEITQRLYLIEEAVKDFNLGCDRLQQAIVQPNLLKDSQKAIAQMIRGSDYLLTLAEQYLYPRRNWLQRQLYERVKLLNFSKFRLEERIKTIRYILDYLKRLFSQADAQNTIQQRRLEQYIKTLPVEVCHLTEWLKQKLESQKVKS